MAVLEAERDIISKPRQAASEHAEIEEPEPYTSEEFAALAADYPDLRMELTREGELVIMPPPFSETGSQNADVTADLVIWNRKTRTGKVFDSSSVFTLPSGAKRSPDTAWIKQDRWDALTEDERQGFSRICPDFVVELRSTTDRLSDVQRKMGEYRDNGAKLGWLLDPKSKRVEVYRPGQEVEILDNPVSLSGEDVLPGFTLDLTGILS